MVNVEETDNRFQLTMPATLENIDEADDRVAAYLLDKHTHVDVFAMRILLRESLLNAVTHGSGKDPDKSVKLDLEIGPTSVSMYVKDTGAGFEWRNYQGDFDIDGDGGRGLALMKIYSDEMVYNEAGNEVTIRKDLTFVLAEQAGKVKNTEKGKSC